MSRLQKKYKEEVLPELIARHPDRCVMELPVLKKIVISMGLSEALKDKNAIQDHSKELAAAIGSKTSRHPFEKSDFEFQIARKPADRTDGHAARKADV